VGYSIGYGALYEYNEVSLLWSLVMIVMGASVIGGAIGFFAANAIDASGDYKPPEEDDVMGDDDKPCACLVATWRSCKNFYTDHQLFVKIYSLLFLWIIMGVVRGYCTSYLFLLSSSSSQQATLAPPFFRSTAPATRSGPSSGACTLRCRG